MAVEPFIKTSLYNSEDDFAKFIKLKPNCMKEMAIKNAYIRGMAHFHGIAYLLLSKRFLDENLKEEHDAGAGAHDCTHLLTIGLCREYLKLSAKPVIIFDNCKELYRFQKLALGTLVGKEDSSSSIRPISGALCKIARNGRTILFRPSRYGRVPPAKFVDGTSRDRTSFSPGTLELPLLLVQDLNDLNENEIDFDIALYVKTKPEYYQSRYPKITIANRPEEKMLDFKEANIPVLVLISDSLCLPRTYYRDRNFLFIPLGEHTQNEERFKLNSKEEPHLGPIASAVNDRLERLFSELKFHHEKVNLSYLVACALYGPRWTVAFDVDQIYLRRTSKNTEVRQRVEEVIKSIKDMRRHMADLKPEIKDWNDIYELRKKMRTEEIILDCQTELLRSINTVFTLLFYDSFVFRIQIDGFPKTEMDLAVVAKKASENLFGASKILMSGENVKTDEDDFDPEEPSAYMDYKPLEETKGDVPTEASYFVMENEGKLYVYYTLLDKDTTIELVNQKSKPISELGPGDIIQRKYWDYPTLRGRLLDYIKNQTESEGDETGELARLGKEIELADQFKAALYNYVMSKTRTELQNKYYKISERSEIRSLLLSWVSLVMCPTKESLFGAVFADVAMLNPNAEFSKRNILSILGDIKDRRSFFKNSKDYDKEIETYRVIEGPMKTVVGANKLGKIYRYS